MKEFFKALWRTWLKIAHLIGKVNTTLLLSVFYLLFIGLAKLGELISRQDPLDRKWKDRESYWKKREECKPEKEAFLKPY